jgi:DNA-binding NtrC family response regulator
VPGTPRISRFGSIVGSGPEITDVFDRVEKAAHVGVPVLILGETGTGKELVAREIHARGERRNGPFIAVNTGALSADLVASELFGHVKGSFTGAVDNYDGRFAEANHGTLFLDEISTMIERVQVVFLRVLEEGIFRPIGARRDKQVDVRVIAATSTDLRQSVESGRFREDLLQRLTVIRIVLPPLRERLDDLHMLVSYFLEQMRQEFGIHVEGVADSTLDILARYPWPGNIRELKNAIAQSGIIAGHGIILPEHIPLRIIEFLNRDHDLQSAPVRISPIPRQDTLGAQGMTNFAAPETHRPSLTVPLGWPLDEVRKAYVLRTLAACSYNKTHAAETLGVSRKTIHQWLMQWDIVGGSDQDCPKNSQ